MTKWGVTKPATYKYFKFEKGDTGNTWYFTKFGLYTINRRPGGQHWK